MTNIEKIDSVEDFKKSLLEIDKLLKSDRTFTIQDLEVMNDLATVLENQVKIRLFDKMVQSKNPSRIISDIDSKIEELSQQLDALQSEPLEDKIAYRHKVQNYKRVIEELKQLKENYKNKDYENLVKDTFELGKGKKLTTWCCGSLAIGYFEFESLFGETLAESKKSSQNIQPNYNFINNFFEVYQDHDTVQKLKQYFSCVDKVKEMEEDKNTALELNEILPVLKKAEGDIRTYLYYRLIKETYYQDIDIYKMQLESECKKMKASLFKGFKKGKIEDLEKRIAQMDNYAEEKLSSLEEKLRAQGVYDYVEKIMKTMRGQNSYLNDPRNAKEKVGSMYWYSSEITKADVGNMHLDVVDFKPVPFEKEMKKNVNTLQHVEAELPLAEKQKEEIYETLPSQTKEQLKKDSRGMRMVASMDERPKRYNLSPIVSAYILRVIGQMENLSLHEMTDTIKMDQQKLQELEKKYYEILERELNNQQENVDRIYSQGRSK